MTSLPQQAFHLAFFLAPGQGEYWDRRENLILKSNAATSKTHSALPWAADDGRQPSPD